jgi:hypothetical protein
MTVCIGALSDSGRKVVVMADSMVVSGPMLGPATIQREGKGRKIITCGSTIVFMQSGTGECSQWVDGKLKVWVVGRGPATVEEVYEELKRLTVELTTEMRDKHVSANTGASQTLAEFAKTIGGAPLQIHVNFWQTALQINAGDYLIAGVDVTGGEPVGSIYHVPSSLPGASIPVSDKVESFWAIGCGGFHAREVLESYRYDASWNLPNSLYAVYCAKRAAELSPGVDKGCDIRIITGRGTHVPCPKILKSLELTYEHEWSQRKDPEAWPLVSEACREGGVLD